MGGASSARRVLDARTAKPHGTGLHQRSVSRAAGVGFAIPKPGGLFKQPARVSLTGGAKAKYAKSDLASDFFCVIWFFHTLEDFTPSFKQIYLS